MGRWQRTKDVDWWTKAKDDGGAEAVAAAAKAEAAATRAEEEILMQEALGLRPKRSPLRATLSFWLCLKAHTIRARLTKFK